MYGGGDCCTCDMDLSSVEGMIRAVRIKRAAKRILDLEHTRQVKLGHAPNQYLGQNEIEDIIAEELK
jgi:hypothetical protein